MSESKFNAPICHSLSDLLDFSKAGAFSSDGLYFCIADSHDPYSAYFLVLSVFAPECFFAAVMFAGYCRDRISLDDGQFCVVVDPVERLVYYV